MANLHRPTTGDFGGREPGLPSFADTLDIAAGRYRYPGSETNSANGRGATGPHTPGHPTREAAVGELTYTLYAKGPGTPVLRYIGGDKLSARHRPHGFHAQSAAISIAARMCNEYPVLREYHWWVD